MKLDKHIKCTYLGVYDGHKTSACAEYLKYHLHEVIRSKLDHKLYGVKNSQNVNWSIT